MTLIARDIMQDEVVTVCPELSLLGVHQLFVAEEIHGAPVIDETETVRGVISSADLLRGNIAQRLQEQTFRRSKHTDWGSLLLACSPL